MFGNSFWCKEDTLAERREDEAHEEKMKNERIIELKIQNFKNKSKDFVMINGNKNECITNFFMMKNT